MTKYYVYSRDRTGVRYYYPNPNYTLAECLRKGYFHSAVSLAEVDMFNSQFEAARFKQQCHLNFCFVGSTDDSVARAEDWAMSLEGEFIEPASRVKMTYPKGMAMGTVPEILRDNGPTPEILENAA
jgi:hypothetical protein